MNVIIRHHICASITPAIIFMHSCAKTRKACFSRKILRKANKTQFSLLIISNYTDEWFFSEMINEKSTEVGNYSITQNPRNRLAIWTLREAIFMMIIYLLVGSIKTLLSLTGGSVLQQMERFLSVTPSNNNWS